MTIAWNYDTTATDSYINQSIYGGLGQGDGIDLRLELNRLLYGYGPKVPKGHWVVLRQFDSSRVSTNYNKCTHEGVNGPAYEYTDVFVRTRRVPVSKRSDALEVIKPGIAISDAFTYYFEYMVSPKLSYQILEADPTFDHRTTSPNMNAFVISDKLVIRRVHPYRLENGSIQYWAVIAEVDQMRY